MTGPPMTVERYHRWAAGRWERRDRVNRVSSSIPSTFSPSFLPSFLPRFAHARTRYVNSALERLFNGSRPRQRESGKKKKEKRFTRLSLPVSSPVSGLEGGCSVDSLAPSFLSFPFLLFFSIRLDSTRFREFVEEKLHEERGYIWLSRSVYIYRLTSCR